jgi:general secretion pathway protein D
MNVSHRIPRARIAGLVLALVTAAAVCAQGVGALVQARNQTVQNAVLRDPTQPGAGLQQLLQSGTSNGGRLLRIEVRGTGTNATPAEVEEFRKAKPRERMIDSIEATGAPFVDVARNLAKATGMNIAPSTLAGASPISIYLVNLPSQAVLETLCNAHGLWLKEDDKNGIIRVYTVGEFRRDLASFRDEHTEVFTLLYPNAFDIANAIADLFGDRVEVSLGEYDDQISSELSQRMSRFDIIDQRASGLGQGSGLGGGGGGGNGGGGGFGGGGGGGRGNGGNFGTAGGGFGGGGAQGGGGRRRNAGAQAQLPVQNLANPNLNADQVQTLADAQQSGDKAEAARAVDLAIGRRVTIHVTVMRRQNRLLIRTADESALTDIKGLISKLDVPQSMVLLDVRVLRVSLGNGFNSAFDYSTVKGVGDGTVAGAYNTGEITPPTGGFPVPNMNPGGYDSQSLVFQYLGQNVRARLTLLENKNRLTAIASPVLLTANNEVSRVFVGEEVPITRGFNGGGSIPTQGSTVVQNANAEIEFRPVGTTLLLTPNINADRTVTLRLVQENSTLKANGATIPVPTAGGGFRNQAVDIVQSRTVSGTFVAQHEQSVVIGGLMEETEQLDRAGIPFLSEIPILGAAFRRDTKTKGRSELVVIIRPFIINTPREAEAISQRLTRELSLNPKVWANSPPKLGNFTTNDLIHTDPIDAKKAQRAADKKSGK